MLILKYVVYTRIFKVLLLQFERANGCVKNTKPQIKKELSD